jgi:nitrate/nitrite transport system permease protein
MPKKIVVMGKPFDAAKPDAYVAGVRHQARVKLGLAARAALLSLLIALVALGAWHMATLPKAGAQQAMDPEYAKLMGLDKPKTDGLPTLAQLGATAWKQLSNPFYDRGQQRQGDRHPACLFPGASGPGFALAALVAVPLGFVIGLSPLIPSAR